MSDLRNEIDADQRLLVQWGDEKIELGLVGLNLVKFHMTQLDKDTKALERELKVSLF